MPDPTPVVIATDQQEPVPVTIAPESLPLVAATATKGKGTTLMPTTTEAEDRVTEGQRHISRIWEYTQAIIAILVVGATIFMTVTLALRTEEPSANALLVASQLIVMATYIITSYYTRTNHQNIGGVGPKANEPPYKGR